jgi:hypothetical protein
MGGFWSAVGVDQVGGVARPFKDDAALTALFRLPAQNGGNGRPGLNAAKCPLNLGNHLFGVEVASDHNHRIVGPVVGAVMIIQVIPAHRLQINLVANDLMVVGVDAKGSGRQLLVKQKHRPVFIHVALG